MLPGKSGDFRMSVGKLKITRCPENPIVQPGLYEWRMAATLNPAALYDEGKFYLYERASGGLRPFSAHRHAGKR